MKHGTDESNFGALAGLLAPEFGQLLAGPFCGQSLPDLGNGSDQTQIATPGATPCARRARCGQKTTRRGLRTWAEHCARLDARMREGPSWFRRLAAALDIEIDNFRPQDLEQQGLGRTLLRALTPFLILLKAPRYGQTRPSSAKARPCPGRKSLRCDAFSHLGSGAEQSLARLSLSIGDSVAATCPAIGALASVHARNAAGQGQRVDSVISEACLAMMARVAADDQRFGLIRDGAAPSFQKALAPTSLPRETQRSSGPPIRTALLSAWPLRSAPRSSRKTRASAITAPTRTDKRCSTRSSRPGSPLMARPAYKPPVTGRTRAAGQSTQGDRPF